MNREELLAAVRNRQDELNRILRSVSPERLDQFPGPTAAWTVKDMVAHLTHWQHPTLDRVLGRNAAEGWGDVDAVNRDLLQQSRLRPLEEVLRNFTNSCAQILRDISQLSDDQLLQPAPWNDGKALWEHIADDTFGHYEEHLPALRQWAAAGQSA